MHEAAFSQAALPARVEVLGLRLRPYSLGHELFLWREGIFTAERWNMERLAKAAVICSNNWRENTSCHQDRLLRLKLAIWRFRVLRHVVRDSPLFSLHVSRFAEYVRAGQQEFPLSDIPRPERKPGGRAPGAPLLLRVHHFLVRLGLSIEAAWDFPYGEARMRWMAEMEGEGGFDIYGPYDDAIARSIAAKEKEIEAQSRMGVSPVGQN